MKIAFLVCIMISIGTMKLPADSPRGGVATLQEVLDDKRDLWGIAAMNQKDGADYDFFAGLLPPLRYVNAKFRHYPIVLSAPNSAQKARLISNGSAINARAELNTWREVGTPVSFFVGSEFEPFGQDLARLDGPRYLQGFLPIVQMSYQNGKQTYAQETFATVEWSNHAVLMTRFKLDKGDKGTVTARIGSKTPLRLVEGSLCNDQNQFVMSFSKEWEWNPDQQVLTAELARGGSATLTVATVPLMLAGKTPGAELYVSQKDNCISTWQKLLASGTQITVPERVVNDAAKSTIVGNYLLSRNHHMNYSAGNIYETMYEAESGDAVRALALWGFPTREMIPPLMEYGVNPGLRFHDAAFKLQLLAHYYFLTRDAAFVREQKKRWTSCIEILTRERDQVTALLPRESYCGDEADKVFSLNSNANAWRGLRDMAVVLQEIGEGDIAARTFATAETLRKATIAAVEKSERLDTKPPFLPIALFGEEKPYDVLTSTRRGSYWNLMIPYVIGSGIFSGSERESWMLRYLEEHGGMCMGMIRFHQHSGLFANEEGLDDLYTLRYVDALFRRDEPEPAIASLYGKLAQGMTRDTFLSAEGTGLRPLDKFGRAMYLPPTCSGNALFLWQLRSMLVQDYDLNNDGSPETLRLMFATPRRWLANGNVISLERAPTSFGEVSVRVESKLARGEVIAQVELPTRNQPKRTLLRIRLPDGWKIAGANAGSRKLPIETDGTVDISTLQGKNTLRFKTRKL